MNKYLIAWKIKEREAILKILHIGAETCLLQFFHQFNQMKIEIICYKVIVMKRVLLIIIKLLSVENTYKVKLKYGKYSNIKQKLSL